MDDNQKIQSLKEYFEKRDDVVMALLFGSRAKGYDRASSDWDIGVYLTMEDRAREQEIWTAVERIVGGRDRAAFPKVHRAYKSISCQIASHTSARL